MIGVLCSEVCHDSVELFVNLLFEHRRLFFANAEALQKTTDFSANRIILRGSPFGFVVNVAEIAQLFEGILTKMKEFLSESGLSQGSLCQLGGQIVNGMFIILILLHKLLNSLHQFHVFLFDAFLQTANDEKDDKSESQNRNNKKVVDPSS